MRQDITCCGGGSESHTHGEKKCSSGAGRYRDKAGGGRNAGRGWRGFTRIEAVVTRWGCETTQELTARRHLPFQLPGKEARPLTCIPLQTAGRSCSIAGPESIPWLVAPVPQREAANRSSRCPARIACAVPGSAVRRRRRRCRPAAVPPAFGARPFAGADTRTQARLRSTRGTQLDFRGAAPPIARCVPAGDQSRSTYPQESLSDRRAPSRDGPQVRLRAAHGRQPASGITLDQRTKPFVQQGCFLIDAGGAARFFDQCLVEDDRGSHTYDSNEPCI